jgi:stage III sporulation protein AF
VAGVSQAGQWVGHLAAVVLLAGVAEMLMPSGRLQGYARAALGLMVLLAVLSPLLAALHQGVAWSLPDVALPPQQAVADEGALTAAVFRQLLAERVAAAADAVPGVQGAQAEVDVVPGEGATPPAVVAVRLTLHGPPGVGPAVAAAVAAALGISPERVKVDVR